MLKMIKFLWSPQIREEVPHSIHRSQNHKALSLKTTSSKIFMSKGWCFYCIETEGFLLITHIPAGFKNTGLNLSRNSAFEPIFPWNCLPCKVLSPATTNKSSAFMQQGSLTENSVQCLNSHSCVPLRGPRVAVTEKNFRKDLLKMSGLTEETKPVVFSKSCCLVCIKSILCLSFINMCNMKSTGDFQIHSEFSIYFPQKALNAAASIPY